MNYANTYHPTPKRAGHWTGLLLLLTPAVALAHPGHYHPGEEDEFDALAAGLTHPISGIDHLLLALAVGWIACSWFRGKPLAAAIAAFISALGAATLIGGHLQPGPWLGLSMAVALMITGGALVIRKLPPSVIGVGALAVVGALFGISHDPAAIGGPSFGSHTLGFLVGTIALLAAGGFSQRMVAKLQRPSIPRIVAAALIGAGSLSLIHSF